MDQWAALLHAEHFLGAGPLAGRRLRYLIESPHLGTVAALAFSTPGWRRAAGDRFIGWDYAKRERGLPRIVANSRFLIRPGIQVPGLDLHVLACCLRQFPRECATRFGEAPVLVETFVDRMGHRGCYRAANWQYVGDTVGRGRNDTRHQRPRSVKAVYVYALRGDWRRHLGGAVAPAWPGGRRLAAPRVRPAALGRPAVARARTKACDRVLANPKVTVEALLDAHYEAITGRCRQHAVALTVQDTTTLNYPAQTPTDDLGSIGSRRDGAQGLIVHDTLAFSVEGTRVRLIDMQAWARDCDDHGLRQIAGDNRDLDDKESGKRLGLRNSSVGAPVGDLLI